MALAAQNQVRNLFIGLDYPEHASVAALKGGANGDITILSADGTVAAAGEKFMLLKKSNKGTMLSSDVINPANVLYSKSFAYVAPVLGSSTLSALTVDVNTLYTVEVAISGFGSLSVEDEYIKKAFYKAITGDDQEAIVDGLILSLNRNFSREVGATATDNPYFTFAKTGSGASAALVITEKEVTGFDADTNQRLNTDFRVNSSFTTNPTQVDVASSAGVGSGKQVAIDEFYLDGETGDFMRGAGYPHNFKNTYDADETATYNTIEVGYYEEGRDEAKKSKKSLTICVPTVNLADNATTNLVIAELNTILGAGSVAALPVS